MLEESELDVIAHWVASETLLPMQCPAPSQWSAERRLAGAVLADALREVRDHHHNPARRRAVIDDLRWILSDDDGWPFAFIRLCHLLGVEPDYVRDTVRRWVSKECLTLLSLGVVDGSVGRRRRSAASNGKAVSARLEHGSLPEGIVWPQRCRSPLAVTHRNGNELTRSSATSGVRT